YSSTVSIMITIRIACFCGGSADRSKRRLLQVECEDDRLPAIATLTGREGQASEFYQLEGMTDPIRLPDGTQQSFPRYGFVYHADPQRRPRRGLQRDVSTPPNRNRRWITATWHFPRI